MKSVEDLKVFKLAHKIALEIYAISGKFPKEETFGLTSQLRRAGGSINANLLEDSNRISTKEYRQFVGIARGSAGELKYHLLLARALKYLSINEYDQLIKKVNEVLKMLTGLVTTLSKRACDV